MNSEFFQHLIQDLKHTGQGKPQLIVDKVQLFHNLQMIKPLFKDQIYPRLVVKSLSNLKLLRDISQYLNTDRFMVFHLPQLETMLELWPEADYLLGKPMPIRALEQFYQNSQVWQADIQWLIDQPKRLLQYLAFAKQKQLKLKVNIEIDVGLHRGGVQSAAEFLAVLKIIVQHPQHLKFSGLMGYDAHVAKLPKWLKKTDHAYRQSQDCYQSYQELILKHYPQLWHDQLCFNGGGSPTLMLHTQKSVCNDVAFGSVLLKPSDFDLEGLQDFHPALWIASPVLKVEPQIQVPALEILTKLPHKRQAIFIYGGYWLAHYVYPADLKIHPLYGRSTNQEMLTAPLSTLIDIEDYVIARPTQSESVLPQFQHLYIYDKHQFIATDNLRE